jgi:predicted dehydrogenase
MLARAPFRNPVNRRTKREELMINKRQPYRLAIIGTGGIAHSHASAIEQLGSRAELVAVVDIDAERARTFATQYGSPTVYSSTADLLANEDLDLVHICTPPITHASLASEAMRAGVPSLVEKPTTLSLHEIDELIAVQSETGVPVLTVFQHRFGAGARRLRRLAEQGVLGRPLVAVCETLWFRGDDYFAVPWRGRWDVEGGGPTMGHGIHQFDMLLSILGDWREVSAFAARQTRPTDTEEVSIALARFESGAVATVVNSIVSPKETSRLRFDFEYATVEVNHLYGYSDADWDFTPAPGHDDLQDNWNVEHGDEVTSHCTQLAGILDAFDTGAAPGVSLADARRTLEFAAATYASAFRNRPVAAGDILPGDPFEVSMDGGLVPWPQRKEVVA